MTPRRLLAAIIGACSLLGGVAGSARAQNAEDQLGNWLIYNGTIRFADHWSVFTEAQLRLWEVASNVNETILRAAAHYSFTPEVMVGLGYLRADTWPFEDSERERIENRLYQQFGLLISWNRTRFDHRYRVEQRWLRESGDIHYSTRLRYRLQVTTPLNRESMEPGAIFLNFYDEIFIGFDRARVFDQNRLYGAGGYQFTELSNLQLGLLWQARASADFFRLQIFYTHNFDFR
jgi:hypothetical protein